MATKPVLLLINASIFGENGQSTRLSRTFVEQWRQRFPAGVVIERDLNAQPLPHFDADYLSALSTPSEQRSPAQAQRVALADQLIDELKQAQVLVMGLPMYNFGVPSQLKAWIDYLARAGSTFRYTANGPQGLAGDRPTIIFATRGGHYRDTPADSQTPYMNSFLNFVGINDIHYVYAEGLAKGEAAQREALRRAQQAASDWLTRREFDFAPPQAA